jgi:NAD(P)-dependent dehydrogenase (short-subunit alcohol dehydrogenase family)
MSASRQSPGIQPPFRLDGRRALVAGASAGIGRACAQALAEAGAEVVLLARSEEAIESLAAAISSNGGRAQAIACDVTDEQRLRQLLAQLPPCEILLNAIGGNDPTPLTQVTAQQYERLFALNVRSAYFLIQTVAARLLEAGRPGSLITISSQMGHVGAPLRTVYCATKHAVEGLSKAAAVELAPRHIRVNTIAPTFVKTEMTREMFADPQFTADVLSRIPLGEIGQPQDVAGAAVFLASDASRLVTGTSLLVDGGWTAR